VPDRLARPRVAHRRRKGGHEHAVGRVVILDEDPVALDAGRGRHVVRLGLADERVDQQAVDGLERALGQVLVRPVDRVTRLEPDHPLPAPLGERGAGLGGIERELWERRLCPLEHGHTAGQVERLLRVETRHAGVIVFDRAEAALGLPLLVVLEGLVDLEHGERRAGLVSQHDLVAVGSAVDREADRQRPRQTAR
jgi:hypothetical protein